jgi:hypothetical protein
VYIALFIYLCVIKGTPPAHPLLRAVAVMAPELRPQRAQLARLVSARARHLREGDACALAGVETRAEETQGGVLHAGLAIVRYMNRHYVLSSSSLLVFFFFFFLNAALAKLKLGRAQRQTWRTHSN